MRIHASSGCPISREPKIDHRHLGIPTSCPRGDHRTLHRNMIDPASVAERAAGGGGTKRPRATGNKQESAGPTTAAQGTFTRRVARTCHNADCGKNPYFGWHGEKAIFCVAHKEPGERQGGHVSHAVYFARGIRGFLLLLTT